MKVITIKQDLVEAIKKVSVAVVSKSILPALQGILLKAADKKLIIEGYNIDLGIVSTLTDVVVAKEGSIVVEAKMLSSIASKAGDNKIQIESDDKNIIHISSGKSKFELVGIPADEYPDLPVIHKDESISITFDKAEPFKQSIKTVKYACNEKHPKPLYTGILLDFDSVNLNIVAVDGYRMAVKKIAVPTKKKFSVVIPKKPLEEVTKTFNDSDKIEIIIGLRYCAFKKDNNIILTRMIDGTFLDYNQTIPSISKTKAKVKTKDMLATSERMNLFNNDKIIAPAKLTVTNDNKINFTSKTLIGLCKDEVNCSIEGEEVTIGFNSSYMCDLLKQIEEEELVIEFSGELSPALVKPSDNELHLLVPMRLAN